MLSLPETLQSESVLAQWRLYALTAPPPANASLDDLLALAVPPGGVGLPQDPIRGIDPFLSVVGFDGYVRFGLQPEGTTLHGLLAVFTGDYPGLSAVGVFTSPVALSPRDDQVRVSFTLSGY